MTWRKRASRRRPEKTSARAKGAGETEAKQYAGAFERVQLVRAWIAAIAAIVAMLSAYVALLERLVMWWSIYTGSVSGSIRGLHSVVSMMTVRT